MKFSIKLSSFLLLTTAPVFADELVVLDEIIVTAGYTDTGISETGASVSVLGAQELQNSTSGIIQAFESVPGVSMDTNGGLGTLTTISVRGLKQKYIGVRLDGMDITDPSGTQTSYDFGGLTSMGLSQVEFLKGSQSAVFGSEAVGGVINLKTISSTDEGERGKFTVEGGSYDTYSSSLSYESVGTNGAIAATLSRAETGGFSAKKTGDGANEVDPYYGDQLVVSFDHNLNENFGLSLTSLSSSSILKYDAFDPLYDTQDKDIKSTKLGFKFNLGMLANEFAVTVGDFTRVLTDDTNRSVYDSDRRDIIYKGKVSFNNADFTFGTSTSDEDIKIITPWTDDAGTDKEQAFFIEGNSYINGSMQVSVTARLTDSDDFGSNTSYRTALVYALDGGLTLRGLASSGFRAPSLYERYADTYGNMNLKPEESATQELGVEKIFEGGSNARITLFNTKVDNLIDAPAPTYNYIQTGEAYKSKGLEIEGLWKISDLISVEGNYTHTDAMQGSDVAARVPRNDYSISVAASISPQISSSLTANHIRGYKDTVSGSLVDMPNYTVVNAAANYTFTKGLEGYVRVQDLMDSDYETIKDFNTGGRQIFAGIRATF